MYLQIILTHGRDTLSFTGYNYYILSKPKDMPTVGNVTINRAAHEGKASAFPEQYLTFDNLSITLIPRFVQYEVDRTDNERGCYKSLRD